MTNSSMNPSLRPFVGWPPPPATRPRNRAASRLAAGQVIKIPGRQPATPPPPVAEPSTQPAAAPAPAPAPEPRPELADAMKRGAEQEKAGNLEAAYATYVDAASRYPTAQDAAKKRDAKQADINARTQREYELAHDD